MEIISQDEKLKKITSETVLENIKSNYLLIKIFDFLKKNKLLDIIKNRFKY